MIDNHARGIWIRGTGVAVVACVVIVGLTILSRRESVPELLQKGQESFVAGDFAVAAGFADQILRRDPHLTEALHLAGRARLEQSRPDEALEYFERIPDESSLGALQARCLAGEVLAVNLKQLSAAELQFRRALEIDPQNEFANDRLAWLLGLSARSREATPYRLTTVDDQRATREQLFVLAIGDLARENPALLEEFRIAAPTDPAVQLALAVRLGDEQQYDQAVDLLRKVIQQHPDWIEPHVRLGRLLLENGRGDDWVNWQAGLPEDADAHPGIWAVRGVRSLRDQQVPTAVRCLWESVRRDPNVQQTNYQLGQALVALDRADEAEPFLNRAAGLQEYLYFVHQVHGGKAGEDGKELFAAASSAASLGLYLESLGWAWLALKDDPHFLKAHRLVLDIREVSKDQTTRCHPDFNTALLVDYSEFPLPDWDDASTSADSPAQFSRNDLIQFEDRAADAGIRFRYFNGGDPEQPHVVPLHEQTGGGVAACDYDGDGIVDLYFTQGSVWPRDSQQADQLDRLFRNLGSDVFADITQAARLHENGFSQGVSVGDFDNDGFSDLYVGNIGANRLYRNQGDGTFVDVTANSLTGGEDWTTSSVICDLNGDSLPDIYAVNYLAGDDLFERECFGPDGLPRPCRIQSYAAAQDRLYRNVGDGSFEDVTATSGIKLPEGRGLGIVVADLDDSGTPDLFVANDVSANFYFVNQSTAGSNELRFEERGVLAGLAFNENGEYEAGMGVAAGDTDGDGAIELFVTNFERESNTLYRRERDGLYADVTWRAGLKDAGVEWLGFGTQFLDADLDGDLDVIVTNGHVDDVRASGLPYRMPPQLFTNRGDGVFKESPAEQLGPYFAGEYLGRGLARLDWNRDGREDIVISHLDAPVALLTNTTVTENRFVAVTVKGTVADRDAIGATLTLELMSSRRITRHLTAGDGYQATNQRRLLIGVPQSEEVSRLLIDWPSSEVQEIADVPMNQELIVVEGRNAVVAALEE